MDAGSSPSVPGLRHAATQAVFPALTPPSTTTSESEPAPRPKAGAGWGDAENAVPLEPAIPEEGRFRRVDGEPRQGSNTLAWGVAPRCEDCGALVGGSQAVVEGREGWCIATLCECSDQPWFTQESAWIDDPDDAEAALESGDYPLP